MNALLEAKQDVQEALEGIGLTSYDYWPEVLSAPVALIGWGEPYLEQLAEPTFCQVGEGFQVRLMVMLISEVGSNAKQTYQLEDLICRAIPALENWTLESVTKPYSDTYNGATYLSVELTITAEIQITEVN